MNAVAVIDRHRTFRKGDSVVVLYQGLYDGLLGRFVGPRDDRNWANIEERDGSIRAYPVAWMRQSEDVQT
jgi:hypothetical protein